MPPLSSLDPRTVTVIIPQFNQPELTIQAIQTLRRTDPIRWPVLVVDNGSAPDSLRQLQQLHDSDVEIISLPQAGLTAAWNAAARQCHADRLVFLNNDTVSQGPWVEALLGPLTRGETRLTGVAPRRESFLTPAVDLLAGWCFALHRWTFNAVQGFDSAMGLYFSDTDFQLRVRRHFNGSSSAPWKVVAGLPIAHLSHQTAHRLPHQKACWNADHEKFLFRWREHQ